MEIHEERIANTLVLRASGRLDGTTAPTFEAALLERIETKPRRLVLDFAEVEFVSSAGLRSILVAVKRGRTIGCVPAVCRLQDHILEVFELSGFRNVLEIHATLEEALGS